MTWFKVRTNALERTLDAAMAELVELRKERADLLRALADARDRGDRIANALLEAKGAEPIPPSPSPSIREFDPFEEDATMTEEIRKLITEQGVGAAFNGRG